jgi:hypothetical protein
VTADWLGVVATGQSLSTGEEPVLTKDQPFGHLKLSLGTTVVPPWDADSQALAMVPLIEPLRGPGSGFPRAYPGNLWGETGYAVMANQITALVRSAEPAAEIVIVPTAVGENGQGIEALVKRAITDGQTGRAYAASLFEVAAIARLARAQGRRYRVAMVMMTHGETDNNNAGYGDALVKLLDEYNADLKAITGQTGRIPMFLSQQFAFPSGRGERPLVNQVQWQLATSHPEDFVCTGPKYHLMGGGDGIHLSAVGYQQHGEKTAQVFYERLVRGRDWRPLHPLGVTRAGRTITVRFHVPVPSLRWNEALDPAPVASWANGRGFEVRAGAAPMDIARVEISGADAVRITCAADLPASGLVVGYAMTSGGLQMSTHSRSYRWGQLHDADPFVGQTTGLSQPNYCVSFEMPVP